MTKAECIQYVKDHLEVRYATNNGAYKANGRHTGQGCVNHSVGCAQPRADVFFNLMDTASAGWGVNAILGDFHEGEGKIILTLKPETKPWGCGSGSKGSWNSSKVQWEICEPAGHTYAGGTMINYNVAKNQEYFDRMWKMVVAWNVYMADYFGYPVTGISDHSESYKAGYGSNHSDVMQWWPKHGKSMDALRAEVAAILGAPNGAPPSNPAPGTPDISNTGLYRVRKTWSDISSQLGAYASLANAKNTCDAHPGYSVFDSTGKAIYPTSSSSAPTFHEYPVRIATHDLRIRKGPGTNYDWIGHYTGVGMFTIVEEAQGQGSTKGWGKLKSGAGWVSLDYCNKL